MTEDLHSVAIAVVDNGGFIRSWMSTAPGDSIEYQMVDISE